jgi:hypothetical protein
MLQVGIAAKRRNRYRLTRQSLLSVGRARCTKCGRHAAQCAFYEDRVLAVPGTDFAPCSSSEVCNSAQTPLGGQVILGQS